MLPRRRSRAHAPQALARARHKRPPRRAPAHTPLPRPAPQLTNNASHHTRAPQAGPLDVAQLPRTLARRARAPSSSSSSSESSDSSSESEAESAVSARLQCRLRAQQQLMRQQIAEPEAAAAALMAAAAGQGNILPAAALSPAAAAAPASPAAAAAPPVAYSPPAAATVVRVCTGKKCSAAGSEAVLAQLAAQPGVVAQPTKCLKMCKRCVVAEMATVGAAGGSAALYTGLNPANVAGVLAMHRQQPPAAPAARR